MTDKIYIGIDPGVKTGIAVWDGKDIVFDTTDFWGVIEEVDLWNIPVTVVIEDPYQNSPVWHGRNKNEAVKSKISERVGMNKREAQLLIEYCERNEIEFRAVKPTTSKWDAKYLKAVTGINKRTNQHVRDAIKLVYGL